MSGFFKKLFNRVVGKDEAPAAPAAETVAPPPPPPPPPPPVAAAPVTRTAVPPPVVLEPVPIETPQAVEDEVVGDDDEDLSWLEAEALGPEDDEPLEDDEEASEVEEEEPLEAEVIPELPPPEPVIALPVPQPETVALQESKTKKPSAVEKLKSIWPFGKKGAAAIEPVAEIIPAPAPVAPTPPPPPEAQAPPAPKTPAPKTKVKQSVPEVEAKAVPEPVVEPAAVPEPAPGPVVTAEAPAPSRKDKRRKKQQAADDAAAAKAAAKAKSATPISITEVEAVQVQTKAKLKKEPVAPVAPAPEPEPEKKGWLSRLKEGLSKSSKSITSQITTIFTKRKLDAGTLQELEDTLIQADLGIAVSERIIARVSHGRFDKEIDPEEVKSILADEVAKVLRPVEVAFNFGEEKPFVILVVGVNGSGKTTTIGKLGAIAAQENFKVKFAACDTFRAAAIEQLTVWGKRIGAETIWRPQGADAAGLAFDAMKACKADGTDILFIDTAGRLHNKTYLMDELDKVVRVIKKYDAEAPHAVLLVLDATTGQNALAQAEAFTKVAGVTGLIMTKLDGTARGGILVAIAEKFKLPIHAIGVGETLDDLQPFDAEAFSRAIAGLDEKVAA
jgi:fused signal recognition particle receptor